VSRFVIFLFNETKILAIQIDIAISFISSISNTSMFKIASAAKKKPAKHSGQRRNFEVWKHEKNTSEINEQSVCQSGIIR
jgi:hypothetical protein